VAEPADRRARLQVSEGQRLLKDPDYAPLRGYVNGQQVTYAVPKAIEALIRDESRQKLGGGVGAAWNAIMGGFRMAATSKNPVFLAGNAANDLAAYTIRESARDGLGPLSAPRALADLALAYVDAFRGITSGEFRGSTAEYLKGGGGQFGFFSGKPQDAAAAVEAMQRHNVFEVKSASDLRRLGLDILKLNPVSALGERIELAPRVASYKRALRRGENQIQAVIRGRDVTIDFARGGNWAKTLNQFFPFFNVGIQGAATVSRAFAENPRGTALAAIGLIGVPTMAAEAWNRGYGNPDGSVDNQRAADYADVPQYIKDNGVVIMLPGDAPRDATGQRKPQYAYLRLREWAPFATMAREVASRFAGGEQRSWQELAGQALQASSPVNNLSSLIPPVASTAIQLQQNRDLYRGRDIATPRADQQASSVGQALSGPLSAVAHTVTGNPNADVRPSQVDFALRSYGAGLAGVGLAAADTAAGRPQTRSAGIGGVPVVGGLAGRVVGEQVGGRMDTAAQPSHMIPANLQSVARNIGVNPEQLVTPVPGTLRNIPLSRQQQALWQELTNARMASSVANAVRQGDWTSPNADRQQILRDAISAARSDAADEMLQRFIAPQQRERATSGR
jgi:hypothetical protein